VRREREGGGPTTYGKRKNIKLSEIVLLYHTSSFVLRRRKGRSKGCEGHRQEQTYNEQPQTAERKLTKR
jgi:hypothetical protein